MTHQIYRYSKIKDVTNNPQFHGTGLSEDDMDCYADSFRNEFGTSTYEWYDGGYTQLLDIRLDNPVCGVITDFDVNSVVNTYPISILSLFSGGLINTEV